MTITIAAFLNPLLMIAMPVLLGMWLAGRLKAEWRLFGLGMLAFLGSQVLHIPFNAWVLLPLAKAWNLTPTAGTTGLVGFALLFGLSAGVFEESARYVTYNRWLRRNRSWRDGLMLGAGHGGMEAILLGLVSFYSFLQLLALRGTDLAQVLQPEQVEITRSILQTYWSLPYYQHLIPALERAAAICVHLALSLLVLQAFTRRNGLWLGLAILWHTMVNAVAVFALYTWGVYVAEGLVVMSALLSVGVVLALRRPQEGAQQMESEPAVSQPSLPRVEPRAEALDRDKLEESRYHEG